MAAPDEAGVAAPDEAGSGEAGVAASGEAGVAAPAEAGVAAPGEAGVAAIVGAGMGGLEASLQRPSTGEGVAMLSSGSDSEDAVEGRAAPPLCCGSRFPVSAAHGGSERRCALALTTECFIQNTGVDAAHAWRQWSRAGALVFEIMDA